MGVVGGTSAFIYLIIVVFVRKICETQYYSELTDKLFLRK